MKLVVGLGNPGQEYENTRHNVGWWVVDHLADVWRFPPWHAASSARAADGVVAGHRVRLLEPLTFMNLSGDALAPYVQRPFWSVRNDLLVIVDDVALPLGAPAPVGAVDPGAQAPINGISLEEYARLRVGVGPGAPIPGEVLRDFVLGAFTPPEAVEVRALLPVLCASVATWITEGIVVAMNRHPGRIASPEPPPSASEPRNVPRASDDRPASQTPPHEPSVGDDRPTSGTPSE